jgi:hypothetical protein
LHRPFGLGLRRGKVHVNFFFLVVSFFGFLDSAASGSFVLPSLSDMTIVDLLDLWICDWPVDFQNPSLENSIHSSQILDTFGHLLDFLVHAGELGIV